MMLLLRDHKRYMSIVEFFEAMTRGLSELSWSETELIASEVSKANQSAFCVGIRGGMTGALKANPKALDDEKLSVVLAFALKVNRQPSSITKEDVDIVLTAGWSEQTVEDIVGLVAIQTLYNVIAAGLGFQKLPEAAFADIGQDTVAKGGYVASFRSFIGSPA